MGIAISPRPYDQRVTCHRTQGEITLGHKSKNKRAWRSMLFWLSVKPWAKNLMPKENMF